MDDRSVRVVAAACDGACSGNPGPGGWGALLRFEDGSQREFGGADPATTNNRMELLAALTLLEVLRELPHQPGLRIRTDSRYLIDGLERWLPGWKRKGWRTASGTPVLNRDLWERLDRARLPGVSLEHVRGHSGDPDNDRCDAIAVAFSRGQSPRLAGGGRGETARRQAPLADRAAAPVAAAPVAPVAAAAPEDSPEAASEAAPGAAGRSLAAAAVPPEERAPAALQRLLSRLELADRLAAAGYGLTAIELAQLVEMPLASLERRRQAWTWRDWLVEPLADGRWRLQRDAGGLAARE